MTGNSREKIIGSIRKSLEEHQLPMPFPEADKADQFFVNDGLSLEEKFATEFARLGGKFVYCANEAEMIQQLQALTDTMKWKEIHVKDRFLQHLFREHQLDFISEDKSMQHIEVGLSLCECMIARTGSVMLTGGQDYGRSLPVYAPIHITLAFTNQLVWDISDAIQFLKTKYNGQLPSMMSLTTGPSRTADIEKTLVVGVHGPKEVYVFLVDEEWKGNQTL